MGMIKNTAIALAFSLGLNTGLGCKKDSEGIQRTQTVDLGDNPASDLKDASLPVPAVLEVPIVDDEEEVLARDRDEACERFRYIGSKPTGYNSFFYEILRGDGAQGIIAGEFNRCREEDKFGDKSLWGHATKSDVVIYARGGDCLLRELKFCEERLEGLAWVGDVAIIEPTYLGRKKPELDIDDIAARINNVPFECSGRFSRLTFDKDPSDREGVYHVYFRVLTEEDNRGNIGLAQDLDYCNRKRGVDSTATYDRPDVSYGTGVKVYKKYCNVRDVKKCKLRTGHHQVGDVAFIKVRPKKVVISAEKSGSEGKSESE